MTDQELQNALQSMGMACFIKHYRQFCHLSLTTDDIAQNMLDNRETWTTILNRARTGRRIILSGRKRDALTRIVGSNARLRARRQAEHLLNES